MRTQRGFTLIEVLVAMLIMAFALIGFAALQATGIKNIQISYARSQAVHLAQDMADRIRANLAAKAVYADVNENSKADIVENSLPGGAKIAACTQASGCSPLELAKYDVYQWKSTIAAALPSGCGSIALANETATAVKNGCGGQIPASLMVNRSNTYLISVNWDEDGNGVVNDKDPNFIMSFDL